MKIRYCLIILGVSGLIAGCSESDDEPQVNGRWYTQSQVVAGEKVFRENCAVCHGNNAQGTGDWKKPLADGSYPPPPLNGSAHTWHHSMSILKRVINQGGIPLGGKMPAFQDKLSDEEVKAVIAYFQSKWSSETYEIWESRINR